MSITNLLLRKSKFSKTLLLVIIHILASIFASLLASILLPNFFKEQNEMIPYPKRNPLSHDYQIFIFEMIIGFLYVFAYYATVLDSKAPNNVFGYAIGSIIGLSILGG